MTVPPLFGWEGILTVVAVLITVGVCYLLVLASRASSDSRSEWQAFLDARSSRQEGPAPDPVDAPAGLLRPEPGG
jgi:hypothetical protein